MLLNSKDIATEFNAEFLSQEFGLQNSTSGDFSGGRYVSFNRQFAGATVIYNFLVRGETETDFYINAWALYEELRVATIVHDDGEIQYTGQAASATIVFHGTDDFASSVFADLEFGVLTVQMLIYQGIGELQEVEDLAGFKPTGVKEPFIILEVTNNTPSELPEIAINGLEAPIVIKTLGAGKTAVINGLETTVMIDNESFVSKYASAGWPEAKAGKTYSVTATPSGGVELVLKYYPRWV